MWPQNNTTTITTTKVRQTLKRKLRVIGLRIISGPGTAFKCVPF